MKQLAPTGLGEYLEEHKEGDVVSGRVVEPTEVLLIELGEGIRANCRLAAGCYAFRKKQQFPCSAAQPHCLRRLYSPSAASFVGGNPGLDEAHNQPVLVAEKLHHLRGRRERPA